MTPSPAVLFLLLLQAATTLGCNGDVDNSRRRNAMLESRVDNLDTTLSTCKLSLSQALEEKNALRDDLEDAKARAVKPDQVAVDKAEWKRLLTAEANEKDRSLQRLAELNQQQLLNNFVWFGFLGLFGFIIFKQGMELARLRALNDDPLRKMMLEDIIQRVKASRLGIEAAAGSSAAGEAAVETLGSASTATAAADIIGNDAGLQGTDAGDADFIDSGVSTSSSVDLDSPRTPGASGRASRGATGGADASVVKPLPRSGSKIENIRKSTSDSVFYDSAKQHESKNDEQNYKCSSTDPTGKSMASPGSLSLPDSNGTSFASCSNGFGPFSATPTGPFSATPTGPFSATPSGPFSGNPSGDSPSASAPGWDDVVERRPDVVGRKVPPIQDEEGREEIGKSGARKRKGKKDKD